MKEQTAAEVAREVACVYRGDEALKIWDLDLAADYYTHALDLRPSARTYANRGVAHLLRGRLESALEDFSRSLDLDRENRFNFHNRAVIYLKLNRPEEALGDFNKAIDLAPAWGDAYSERGAVHLQLGDTRRAFEDFNRAIDLAPDSSRAYLNRGLAYRELEEHRRALEDLNKAVELDPGPGDAYLERAITYRDLGEYSKALEDLNKSIGLGANLSRAHFFWLFGSYLLAFGGVREGPRQLQRGYRPGPGLEPGPPQSGSYVL